jgi:hypothetical protein
MSAGGTLRVSGKFEGACQPGLDAEAAGPGGTPGVRVGVRERAHFDHHGLK